jgi:DNA repair exonuclease SbcCD ATPase subunit
MEKDQFEVTIFLHNGNTSRFIYDDSKENVDDIVSKMWYEGFLETNPKNPKRKIHILPEEIRHIQIKQLEP